jgi:hypothetical protein
METLKMIRQTFREESPNSMRPKKGKASEEHITITVLSKQNSINDMTQ